jgi:arylsulfatase A-like enzyme/tetratricopeptide (TPR) repeat protein
MRSLGIIAIVSILCWNLVACGGAEPAGEIENVLLISIDTCRADRLGCYGFSAATTPNIDNVAAEGTLFRNAIAPTPITLPSHASMLTGAIPPRHAVRDNGYGRLSPNHETLAELLARQGLRTAAFVSAFVLDSRFGLAQGFELYDDRAGEMNPGQLIAETRASETTRRAVEWIDRNGDAPFFLFVHYYDPHRPYDPPEPYRSTFASDPYAGEIAYVDAEVGELLDLLRERGTYESTLIVITADHGEMLGEHAEETHSYFIYQSAIRVPLIIRLPGQKQGREVLEPVGVVDIVPTVAGLLGIAPPVAVQGSDLSPVLHGGQVEEIDRAVYAESLVPTKYGADPLLGLVTDRWKYIESARPELYDLRNDPGESHNVEQQERTVADRLRDRLQATALAGFASDPSIGSLDPDTRRRLESLGYVAAPTGDSGAGDDAKDLIGFHKRHLEVADRISKGDLEAARAVAQRLVEERPTFSDGYVNLARIDRDLGRSDDAVAGYTRALELGPQRADLHSDLGIVLVGAGRTQEGLEHYRRALELDPEFLGARNNLANVLLRQGRTTEAIEEYRRALLRHPDSVVTWLNLGLAFSAQGNRNEALRSLVRARELEPGNPTAAYHLGRALARAGRSEEALSHLAAATELRPDWHPPRSELAWMLATHPDPEVRAPGRAVQLAERSVELTGSRDVRALDVLAAAYAAAGEFDLAVRAAEAALELAEPKVREAIRARLQLYRSGRPFVVGERQAENE